MGLKSDLALQRGVGGGGILKSPGEFVFWNLLLSQGVGIQRSAEKTARPRLRFLLAGS